jgi:NADH-quinone oxidoreductase subunit M
LPLFTNLAVIGLIITALALLLMYQRIFLGSAGDAAQGFADLRPAELWATAPFLAILLLLGIYPAPIMNLFNAAATQLVAVFQRALS